MFVSPSSSWSKSRSFRFDPEVVVTADATESAGDTAPDLLYGAADCDLAVDGLGGGRMLFLCEGATAAGRGIPAIQCFGLE